MTLSILLSWAASLALAQSHPLYVPLSDGANGALHLPDGNPSPTVGVVIVHRTSNVMNHLGCWELSKRGFAVFCLNTRFENNEAELDWEKIVLDVKQAVEYLKKEQRVAKVILFGHSGGGATTTFYQAVAENGPSFCQDPRKLTHCDDSVAGLPLADGVVLVDAHPAIAVNALRAMNPAVFDESRPDLLRPDLDPLNPANGYNPNGKSHYSADFVKRATAAQARRMNEWIDRALYIRELIKLGKWKYPDNDSIIIPRANDRVTNLFSYDTDLLCCTLKPQKLLKDDGTMVTQIIKSVRKPDPGLAKSNATFNSGARVLTLTSFLSGNAIRATDSLDYDKIDWCSSNNSVPCALKSISAPVLIAAMQAHYFIRDSEFFLENAKSADKEFITVEGALHPITPCKDCVGGPYKNSTKIFFDYLAKWMNTRFAAKSGM